MIRTLTLLPQRPYRRKIAETFKDFSPTALALVERLLAIEPSARGTAASALDNAYFRTKPLPCDPASLPKYPPSKEYDAKLRGQEATRQNTTAIGGKGSQTIKPGRDESKAAPAQDAVADHQRRQARTNQKSSSHHCTSQDDSVPGVRMEPPAVGPATMQTVGFGSTWYRNDHKAAVSRTSSSVRVPHLTSQRSAQSRGTDLHPSSSRARNANSRYNRLDVAEPANAAMDRPGSSSHKQDAGTRDTSAGFKAKNKRMIHYSGPLMPPGGNMEDMLREHERQIQEAVRKARVGKEKTNRHHKWASSALP